MDLKVTKGQILLFVFLSIFLIQTLVVLEFVPLLDPLFAGLRLGVFVLLFANVYFKHFYLTTMEKWLFLYAAFLGVVTIALSDTITPFFFQSINIMILLMIFKFFNIKDILCYSTIILSIIVYLNFVLTLFYQEGHFYLEGKPTYLLGYNYNSMGATLLVTIVLNAMYSFRYGKLLPNLLLVSLVSFFTVSYVGSMTSTVGLAVLILYLLVARMRYARFLLKIFFVVVLLFNIGLPFLQMEIDNNYLVWFIEDILGKDLTFTDRARVWLEAILLVIKSPWYGYGVRDVMWFNDQFNVLTAHNFLLTILLKGGVVLLLILICIVWMSVSRANKYKSTEVNVLQFGCSALFLMMTMETYSMVLVFLLIFLNYFAENLYLTEPEDESAL